MIGTPYTEGPKLMQQVENHVRSYPIDIMINQQAVSNLNMLIKSSSKTVQKKLMNQMEKQPCHLPPKWNQSRAKRGHEVVSKIGSALGVWPLVFYGSGIQLISSNSIVDLLSIISTKVPWPEQRISTNLTRKRIDPVDSVHRSYIAVTYGAYSSTCPTGVTLFPNGKGEKSNALQPRCHVASICPRGKMIRLWRRKKRGSGGC